MAKSLDYLITELPDPAYPKYQLAAGGDPRRSIWQDWERLARILINFPPGSITVTMKTVFSPKPANGHVQDRLRLYLSATSNRTDLLDSFRLLIEQGPLSRFYGFAGCETAVPAINELKTACQVIRRTDNLALSTALNSMIGYLLFTIKSILSNLSKTMICWLWTEFLIRPRSRSLSKLFWNRQM